MLGRCLGASGGRCRWLPAFLDNRLHDWRVCWSHRRCHHPDWA